MSMPNCRLWRPLLQIAVALKSHVDGVCSRPPPENSLNNGAAKKRTPGKKSVLMLCGAFTPYSWSVFTLGVSGSCTRRNLE